jgi:hypothetical protein
VIAALVLALAACGDDADSSDGGAFDAARPDGASSFDAASDAALGGFGDPCTGDDDCRMGFECAADETCAPRGDGSLGTPCTYTAECAAELYCARDRTCATAGTGADGDACVTGADCAMGLVCAPGLMGRRCQTAGTADLGQRCIGDDQCIAGLFCVAGICRADDAPLDGGFETCTPDGGVVVCDDSSACTIDMCIADRCVNTLVDGDEDGYAPSVIGPCGLDCADDDAGASPDQTERHAGGAGETQPETFDWNCDGREEERWRDILPPCADATGVCAGPVEGWIGGLASCGNARDYGRCTSAAMGCVQEVVEAGRVQTCR